MRKRRFISLLLAAVMVLTLLSGFCGTAKAATLGLGLDVNRGGETISISVDSQGKTWNVSNNSGYRWITAKKEGNTLKLVVKENDSTTKRTGTVAITIGDKSKGQAVTIISITVSQEPNYHYMTLYAGEGSFNGKSTCIVKVKHGTTIQKALLDNNKSPQGKPGYSFGLYTDEKDPATRTKSPYYIALLYSRIIETDIVLYATYLKN